MPDQGQDARSAACRCWLPIHLRRGQPCPEHERAYRKPLLCRLGFHHLYWNGSVYKCYRRCGHTYESEFTEYEGSIW